VRADDTARDVKGIPEGESRTYAELGFPEKAKHSQAAKVWRDFVDSLTPSV
jgi:inosine/xanthosine triphosphate pyrophosphatase family protein